MKKFFARFDWKLWLLAVLILVGSFASTARADCGSYESQFQFRFDAYSLTPSRDIDVFNDVIYAANVQLSNADCLSRDKLALLCAQPVADIAADAADRKAAALEEWQNTALAPDYVQRMLNRAELLEFNKKEVCQPLFTKDSDEQLLM